MGLPSTWTELLDRLGRAIGDEEGRDVEEWLRGAVEARWGTTTLHDLDRPRRHIAFQKTAGVLLALEEAGLPEEAAPPDGPTLLFYRDGTVEQANGYPGRRAAIRDVVSRYFDGVVVEGPPWRVGSLETDRPTRDEYAATSNFG